jgi:hypothetical protein
MAKKEIEIVKLSAIEMAIVNLRVTRDLLQEEWNLNPNNRIYSVITSLDLDLIELKRLL